MTFDEILDQAIEMLQRRGRLTYRTLKRQFTLDDEALEDLKEELIRLAMDEDARVLAWIGDAGTPQFKPSLATAIPVLEEAVQGAEQYRSLQVQSWFNSYLADAYCKDQQLDNAHEFASKAFEMTRTIKHWGDSTLPRASIPRLNRFTNGCSPSKKKR